MPVIAEMRVHCRDASPLSGFQWAKVGEGRMDFPSGHQIIIGSVVRPCTCTLSHAAPELSNLWGCGESRGFDICESR